jgi:hypothetical protein
MTAFIFLAASVVWSLYMLGCLRRALAPLGDGWRGGESR